MIDGVESLATIAAIDKIDPFRRKSDPNRTLRAMGISNLCSSIAGGLTIIPGGVKSTTSILSGGRTQWANFYNACFLITYLVLGRGLINLMPYSVLGAIVLYPTTCTSGGRWSASTRCSSNRSCRESPAEFPPFACMSPIW